MNEFEKLMMGRATKIMKAQPDLEEQSGIREKHKFQEEDPFWGGEDLLSEKDMERRPCTEQEKIDLDKSIEKLGDLFEGADFFWQLDGALNISLFSGAYIGVHKDIDLSLDVKDIDKAEQFLGKKGFGLFLSSGEGRDVKKVYERVDAKRIRDNHIGLHPMIFEINQDGAIKYGEESFGLDTHIINRNADGKPLINKHNIMPDDWLVPLIVDFHGRKINCSHPAAVAFHKLFCTRAYDDNDLKMLAQSGKLTKEDVDLIEKNLNDNIEGAKKQIMEYLDRNFKKISVENDKDKLFEILVNDELIVENRDDQEVVKFFKNLIEKISVMEKVTMENIYEIIFAAAHASSLEKQRDARIAILRDNLPV